MRPKPNVHVCDVPGCTSTRTTPCVLPMSRGDAPLVWFIRNYGLLTGLRHIWELLTRGETDTYDYYCYEHAWKNGFCWGCGSFWAGSESFDFEPSHLCENCRGDEDEDNEDNWNYVDGLEDTWGEDFVDEEEGPDGDTNS